MQGAGTNSKDNPKSAQKSPQNARASKVPPENLDDNSTNDPSTKLASTAIPSTTAEYIPGDIKSTPDGDGESNAPLTKGKPDEVKGQASVANEAKDIATTPNGDSDSNGDDSTNTPEMENLSVSNEAAQGVPLSIARVTTPVAAAARAGSQQRRQQKGTPQSLSPALVGTVARLDHKVRGFGVRNNGTVQLSVLARLTQPK